MIRILFASLAVILIGLTVLPVVPTSERWVRVWDFPRIQIAALLVIVIVGLAWMTRRDNAFDLAVLALACAALGWQAFRIFPYTPLAPKQVYAATRVAPDSCLRLLMSNVLMENRNPEELLTLIDEEQPDVALFVETDEHWDEALSRLGNAYPYSVRQPQDNHYGMILYSRLPLTDAEVLYLVNENVPSIHAGIVLPSGQEVDFYGVHPVPPPLADTAMRDAELLLVGRKVKESGKPSIVAGDLNDVGWSSTTRLFSRISGLLDPRIGRGLYASYNAENRVLRWPLDHIFHDRRFTVRDLRLLRPVGSDHFPVFVELCHEPEVRAVQSADPADGADKARAREQIREGLTTEPKEGDYPKPK